MAPCALQKHVEAFNTTLKTCDERLTRQLDEEKGAFHRFLDERKLEAQQHSMFMSGKEEEVKRIFNVIGNVALTGDYKNIAEREATAANRLRLLALALMLAMAIIAGTAFWYSLRHPEIDWKVFAFRLGTSLVLALPALYAAQESAKHREREKLNRKLHLELSAIDAYLELLPEDVRHQIKSKLSEKFFGLPESQDKTESISKHELFELFSKVLHNMTKGK